MPARVMIVDDDEDLRESLDVLLTRRGFLVVSASNGQDALESIDPDDPPGLILLDLMMPVMNGWQLRARLLEDVRLAEIPIVLLSGVADLTFEAAPLRTVAALVKPVDLERLYELVAKYC